MGKVTLSKAGALFNFLLDNFDVNRKLGDLNYSDIIKIIEFLNDEQTDEKGSN